MNEENEGKYLKKEKERNDMTRKTIKER